MQWTHWFLYFFGLPWNLLVAWPAILAIRLFWGKDLKWETPPLYSHKTGGGGGPCLTCQIRDKAFPVVPGTFPKGWYLHKSGKPWGGTTLGHAIFYGPGGRKDSNGWTTTQMHEHIHVEQFELSSLQGFMAGILAGMLSLGAGMPRVGLALFGLFWFFGYLSMGVAGWMTAVLRGEPAYRGSSHEESARAQTDLIGRG